RRCARADPYSRAAAAPPGSSRRVAPNLRRRCRAFVGVKTEASVRPWRPGALGRVREKVPVLVNRAALHRHAVPDGGDGFVEPGCAVDDEELGPPQPALDEIVEDGAPGLSALAAHALD